MCYSGEDETDAGDGVTEMKKVFFCITVYNNKGRWRREKMEENRGEEKRGEEKRGEEKSGEEKRGE